MEQKLHSNLLMSSLTCIARHGVFALKLLALLFSCRPSGHQARCKWQNKGHHKQPGETSSGMKRCCLFGLRVEWKECFLLTSDASGRDNPGVNSAGMTAMQV